MCLLTKTNTTVGYNVQRSTSSLATDNEFHPVLFEAQLQEPFSHTYTDMLLLLVHMSSCLAHVRRSLDISLPV